MKWPPRDIGARSLERVQAKNRNRQDPLIEVIGEAGTGFQAAQLPFLLLVVRLVPIGVLFLLLGEMRRRGAQAAKATGQLPAG